MGSVTPSPSPEFLAENKWNGLFVPTTIIFALSWVALVLRFVAAFIARKKLWLDDYFAIIAAVNNLGSWIMAETVWRRIGYGRHVIAALPEHPDVVTTLLKTLFAGQLLYLAALTAAKCSILCFLWRLFNRTTMRWYLLGLLAIVLSWFIALVLVTIFYCVPVDAFWDLTIRNKKCVNRYKTYVGTCVPNIFTDIALTLLPIPYVWKLHISLKEKILVAITLIFGGANCIISAIRLSFIINGFSLADPTWDSVTMMKWTGIEMYCALIAVCLPTLRPLVRLISKKGLETRSDTYRPSNLTIGSRRFRINMSRSSKLNHLAGLTNETDSERALAFDESPLQKNSDGSSVQSFPMVVIETSKKHEV